MSENKELYKIRKSNKKEKAAIGVLSVLLALSASAAVVAPLIISKKIGGDTKVFKVKFESNGGSAVLDQEIVSGKHVAKPAITREGFTLQGWYTEGKTAPWDFANDVVTSDIVLKAQWVENPQPIIYKNITYYPSADGKFSGSEEYIEHQFIKGTSFLSIENKPIPTGITTNKIFQKWVYSAGEEKAGQDVKDTDVFNDHVSITAVFETINNVVVSFVADSDVTLVGSASKDVEINTTISTESDWNKFVPVAKKDKFAFKGWAYTKDATEDDVIKPSTSSKVVFTKNTALYPVFVQSTAYADFKFHHDSTKGEVITGTDSFTLALPESGLKWQEVAKPSIEVTTTPKKYLSGWYKADPTGHEDDYTWLANNVWKDTDVVQAIPECNHAYPLFVDGKNSPRITFEAKTADKDHVTFVGNQIYQSNLADGETYITLDQIKNSIPGVYYDVGGSWETGYTSEYYFDHWETDDPNNPGQYITVDETETQISTSIKIYPTFTHKPTFAFTKRDKSTTYKTMYYSPDDMFGDVGRPNVDEFEYIDGGITYNFIGWAFKEDESKLITNTTLMGYENKTIVPVYSSEFNSVEFLTDGVIDNNGTYAPIPETCHVSFEGSPKLAIKKIATNVSDVVKPRTIVTSDTDVSYSFKCWQVKASDAEEWKTIDSSTIITIPADQTKTQFRPVFTTNYTISYTDEFGGSTIPTAQKTLSFNSTLMFSQLYKPTIDLSGLPEGHKQMVFDNWYWTNPTTGKEEVVSPSQKFNIDSVVSPITIKAKFIKDKVYSTINYNLKAEDAAAGATISGTQLVIQHAAGDAPKFGDVTKGYATKPKYNFAYWATRSGTEGSYVYTKYEDETKIPDDTLNLYAVFEEDVSYYKVNVKLDSKYIVKNDTQYIKNGEALLANFNPTIIYEGHKLKQFKFNGSVVDETTTVTQDMELVPEFEDNVQCNIIISDEGNPAITNFPTVRAAKVGYNSLLKDYINTLLAMEKQPELPNSSFKGWQIKYGENSYGAYNDETRVVSDVTIVPVWEGEGKFYASDKPYFYDADSLGGQKESAVITSCVGNVISIEYPDGTAATIDKTKFKYQVKFGKLLETIPDYFMEGCVNWNNDGQTLVLPKGCYGIGSYFLANCTNFNVPIDFSQCTTKQFESYKQNCFTIDESFMANCVSFNQKLDLSFAETPEGAEYYNYIVCGINFMSECQSFCNEIIIQSDFSIERTGEQDPYSLSSSNKYSSIAQNWITVKAKDPYSQWYAENFVKYYFPELTGKPEEMYRYRKIKWVEITE